MLPRFLRTGLSIAAVALSPLLPLSNANAGFVYAPIGEFIQSASFSADFAALVAHRTIAGNEVNKVTLIDPSGSLTDLDLSAAFFGTSELLAADVPKINQGPLETGIISAAIPSSFFPVLQSGDVGLSFLATDTDDGFFAIDFLALTIQTSSRLVQSFFDSNNGYGIGLADGGMLPGPLPDALPIDSTGTGFDETIGSKSIVSVPEPETLLLFSCGLVMLLAARRPRWGGLIRNAAVAAALLLSGAAWADNDFTPNDLGNTDKVRKDPKYTSQPAADRKYYENGLPQFDHDGVGGHDTNGNGKKDAGEADLDRGDIASFCARYNRGKAPDANVPAAPTTAKEFNALMERIKRCVDDLLSPDKDPQKPGVPFVTDQDIAKFINAGDLGIGNPMTQDKFKKHGITDNNGDGATGFVCIDHALVFASLVRELGFPARQVNVPLSKKVSGANKYVYQEASTEIWFDGAWHYFDAYITKPNSPKANTNPDGLLGGSFTDRKVHFTTAGTDDYDYRTDGDPVPGSGWKKESGGDKNSDFDYEKVASAATIEQTQPGVRTFLTMVSTGLITGWTPDLPGNPLVPDSLKQLFLRPQLTGARVEIPKSGYLPQGVALFDEQKPLAAASVSTVTNETIVVNDPAQATYCVTVRDNTGHGSNFELIVTTEGSARSDFPQSTTGSLLPGETRQVACASLCVDMNNDGICETVSIETPDQLHLVGPGTVTVGTPGNISVALERNFVGVGGRMLVFTRMLGNLSFSKGKVSSDGSLTTLPTDTFGVADMPFVGLSPGRALVKVTVPGTSLTAFTFITIQ